MDEATPHVCFLHIEKAGGTTLHDFFLEILPGYWILPPQQREYGWRYTPDYLNRLRRLLRFRHIGGHQLSADPEYARVLPNALYVTFVREPVSRYLSHVNWRAKSTESVSLRDVLKQPRTLNAQCFRISGERTFAAAQKKMESLPFFVGLTERYTESLTLLQNRLGRSMVPYQSSNLTAAKDKKLSLEDLEPDDLQAIRQANHEDILLYDWICNEFYPNQRRAWQSNRDDDPLPQASLENYRRPRSFAVTKAAKSLICRVAIKLIR